MTISARNYAAQAVAGIRDWAKRAQSLSAYENVAIDAAMVEGVAKSIESSVHFAIPDNGEIFDDDLKGLVGIDFRLPYPSITVEYFAEIDHGRITEATPNYSPKRMILAVEVEKSSLRDIFGSVGVTYDEIEIFGAMDVIPSDIFIYMAVINEVSGVWILNPLGFLMTSKWDFRLAGEETQLICEPLVTPKGKQHMTGRPLPVMPAMYQQIQKEYGDDKALQNCVHDIMGDVRAVMEMCEALACSNVSTDVIQAENSKANAKRIRKGKLPIWETKTLSIEVPKLTGPGGSAGYGDRNAPRQHLRRGHIRRLPDDRRIWVNSCVVGSAEHGRISKGYSVEGHPSAR